jgi:hypothetical protein
LVASKIAISGNLMLRRPEHSKIEVVVPKEEESLIFFLVTIESFPYQTTIPITKIMFDSN